MSFFPHERDYLAQDLACISAYEIDQVLYIIMHTPSMCKHLPWPSEQHSFSFLLYIHRLICPAVQLLILMFTFGSLLHENQSVCPALRIEHPESHSLFLSREMQTVARLTPTALMTDQRRRSTQPWVESIIRKSVVWAEIFREVCRSVIEFGNDCTVVFDFHQKCFFFLAFAGDTSTSWCGFTTEVNHSISFPEKLYQSASKRACTSLVRYTQSFWQHACE